LNFPVSGVSYAAASVPVGLREIAGPARSNRCGAARSARPTKGGTMTMLKTWLFVGAMFAAGTAFASHCPQEMKKIDDALAANPKLTSAQLAEVKKYRAEGETAHKGGDHELSLDLLEKAKKILGIK
jgi:hypothetical protein